MRAERANWGELQRDLADGPEASIARLLAGTSRIQSEKIEVLATNCLNDPIDASPAG
jgi:hypothetical protein